MYLFSLSYPLLLFLCFISLGMIRWRDIASTLFHVWKFLILILPLVALSLRVIRVDSVDKIGIDLGIMQFIYLIIIPLVFFLYMYCINRIRLRVDLQKSLDESAFLYAHNKSIIVIAITNQWLIELLQLMMNNTFYHWIDIIVIPLLRMSVVQVIVCLVLLLERSYYRTKKKYPTKPKREIQFIIIRSSIAMLIVVVVGVVSSLAQMYLIQAMYYRGIIIVVIVVLLGIMATTNIGIIRRQLVNVD